MLFFRELSEEDMYGYFMQDDNAMAYTETFSVTSLGEVLDEWLMTPRLWPSRSPGFNPCNNYFGGYRKIRFL
jgi:hypothetical protein